MTGVETMWPQVHRVPLDRRVDEQPQCAYSSSTVLNDSVGHVCLSQLSAISPEKNEGSAAVEGSSSLEAIGTYSELDEDPCKWKGRLRTVMQKPYTDAPHRSRCQVETDDKNDGGNLTPLRASGPVPLSGLPTHLFGNDGPRRLPSRLLSASRRSAATFGKHCTDFVLPSDWAHHRRWRVTLTTGVVGIDETEDGFMTLECMAPKRSVALLFDENVIIHHLMRIVAPLSYVVRAVFFYNERLGRYVPLTRENCLKVGRQFRVFVVPTHSSPPVAKNHDSLSSDNSSFSSSTEQNEEFGVRKKTSPSLGFASSVSPFGNGGGALWSASEAHVSNPKGHSGHGVAGTTATSNFDKWSNNNRSPVACLRRAVIQAALTQRTLSCDIAPLPSSSSSYSIVATPPLSNIEMLRNEIAEGMARLHTLGNLSPPHGRNNTRRNICTVDHNHDCIHGGQEDKRHTTERRYSFHPPVSIYTSTVGKMRDDGEGKAGE
ncbi:hypothetical protein MOQ_006417 [Trypanosoma cruzi marinkellei]|uniref:Uncharacterized protein n=1 Tax=Trypanosoma cruzi marinkellei TaxID=85056 RepID=K2MVP6_TRYCR|nr:hypothetical protein MOQ_006417 [Trypanosoma cruzi marinkellei]